MATATEVLRPVESSMFTAAGYDDSNYSLLLQFKSTGEVRAYKDVSPDIADEALSAKSLGSFFNQNIKGKFEHEIMPGISQGEILPKVDGLLSDRKAATETVPDTATCQEVKAAIGNRLIECGEPAFKKVLHRRDNRSYFMCDACASHNIHNRGGELVAQRERGNAPEDGLTEDDLDLICKAPSEEKKIEQPSPIPALDAQAAIALPQQKAPEIESIVEQGKKLAEEAMVVKVWDAISYASAGQTLKVLQSARDRAFAFLDPIRAAIYAAYTLTQKKQKEALDPIDNAIAHVKRGMAAYTMEQEHKRQVALQEERRLAEEEAARLQREASEQLTLAEVNDALEAGDTAKAEDLMAHPIEAPKPYVPPAYVPPAVPQVQGVSTRENWKVAKDELDVSKLLQAVKDGKMDVQRAAQLVEFNVPALNKLAKALKTAFDVPGARAYNDAVIASRR